jgi:FKBP-type peptidyl-prolyl cis-trans isomerase 2
MAFLCDNMVEQKVKKGDKVKIDYTGTLDDGTVFDTSKGKDPLEFEAGSGMVIPGFDKAIIGMKKGEEKEINIPCKEAYGEPNPNAVQKIPRDKLPQDQEPKVGMMLGIGLPNGQQMPAKITKVTAKEITIDVNHPLAGKDLNFKLKVVGIN